MAKRGPRGAWKVKGEVRGELFSIFEENASRASAKISDLLFERTRVRVSSSRIRDFRAIWKRGSSTKPVLMVQYLRRARAHPSSSR